MTDNVTSERAVTEPLKPVTAYVPESHKKRLKVLAAQTGKTMSDLATEIYYLGLGMLESQQESDDQAREAS